MLFRYHMALKLIIRRNDAPALTSPLDERVFDEPIITIGRVGGALLRLDDPLVAPEQAIILNEDGYLLIINRATGTLLNGEPLTYEARRPLAHGDRLDIGRYLISISLEADTQTSTTIKLRQPETAASQMSPDAEKPFSNAFPDEVGEASELGARAGSFADILNSLRTEEDCFYFELVSVTRGHERVVIGDAEMLIGWDETRQEVSCDTASVHTPCAYVRKDWSGVAVQPYAPGTLEINGEMVETLQRLHDGDSLRLFPTTVAAGSQQNFLVFHDPAILVVLNSLLTHQLPDPAIPANTATAVETNPHPSAPHVLESATGESLESATAQPEPVSQWRRYFGYFTLGEVTLMVAGTLLTAMIFFLVLELLQQRAITIPTVNATPAVNLRFSTDRPA